MEKLARPYNISTYESRVRPTIYIYRHRHKHRHTHTHRKHRFIRTQSGPTAAARQRLLLAMFTYIYVHTKKTHIFRRKTFYLFIIIFCSLGPNACRQYIMYPAIRRRRIYETNTSSSSRPERHTTGKAHDIFTFILLYISLCYTFAGKRKNKNHKKFGQEKRSLASKRSVY